MKLWAWVDHIPWSILVVGAIFLALAPFPFSPDSEPHLAQKLYLLLQGGLTKPLDIFDLCLHASFPFLLMIRLARAVF